VSGTRRAPARRPAGRLRWPLGDTRGGRAGAGPPRVGEAPGGACGGCWGAGWC